jgi:hypothetical protein
MSDDTRQTIFRTSQADRDALDEIKALLSDNNIQEWITGNMIIL